MADPADIFQASSRGNATVLTFKSIMVDETKILRLQGYRDQSRVRPVIRRAASAAARETEKLIQPAVQYRRLSVASCANGRLELVDGTVFQNEAFRRLLKEVKQIYVFVLTMGHALDDAVKAYIADDQLLNALFLETAGWLGIEVATKLLAVHFKSFAEDTGCRLSPRLGPGYSYKLDGRSVFWPLEQQKVLFQLFSEPGIDVQLLESCAMLPKISRSGIFGLLPQNV